MTATRRTIVKLGGELLEPGADLRGLTRTLAVIAAEGPLVVVHGGGKEIDAECARRGIAKVAVDGLRVTDAATLDAVVTVLSGAVNTRLVAALAASATAAVGLTGADASCVLVEKAAPHRAVDGRLVDLGLVGTPVGTSWPGVLDATQSLIAHLDPAGIDALVADGTASAGMVAKLTACRRALEAGVDEISIVDARTPERLVSRTGTRISRSLQESQS